MSSNISFEWIVGPKIINGQGDHHPDRAQNRSLRTGSFGVLVVVVLVLVLLFFFFLEKKQPEKSHG